MFYYVQPAAGTPQTPVKCALPRVREKSAAGAAAGLQNRVGLRKGLGRFDSYLLPPEFLQMGERCSPCYNNGRP
jgi:hypothetical protein